MKKLNKIRKHLELHWIISLKWIKSFWVGKKQLNKWIEEKELLKLKWGYFHDAKKTFTTNICKIYAGKYDEWSYFSFDGALHEYGVIMDYIFPITMAWNKDEEFQEHNHRYLFVKIPETMKFWYYTAWFLRIDVEWKPLNYHRVATLEKALLDFFYLDWIIAKAPLEIDDFDILRFHKWELREKINKESILKNSKRCNIKNVIDSTIAFVKWLETDECFYDY